MRFFGNSVQRLLLGALLVGGLASPAVLVAQSATVYANGTVDGYESGSAVLGTSLHWRDRGWGPVASVNLQYVQFEDGADGTVNRFVLGPAAGLGYRTSGGGFQAKVGYNFRLSGDENGDEDDINSALEGEGGGSGLTSSVIGQYWGNGRQDVMGIASYNWNSEYLWSQLNASRVVARSDAGSFSLGAQYTWQGDVPGPEMGDRDYAQSLGPLLRWGNNRNTVVTVSSGWKDRNEDDATWYVNLGVARYGIRF